MQGGVGVVATNEPVTRILRGRGGTSETPAWGVTGQPPSTPILAAGA